jgi:serpin B
MTYNGASGSTKDAMAKTLGYLGVSLDAVNAGNKALLANLESPGEGIEISVANSLWARKNVEFKSEFMQRNRDFFGAEVSTLDLGDPAAKDTINSWVKDKTRGKVNGIVDQIDRDSVLFLVNAVYFKGIWSELFDRLETHDAQFTLANGDRKTVPMMSHSRSYEYLQGDGFKLINLGYGKGRISMYVLLPAKGVSLSQFSKRLTPENWAKWMKKIHGNRSELTLALPKFRMETKSELIEPLSALGMGAACDPRADFSAMSPIGKPLYIERVTHKTFVDVNEDGTEAAAATGAEMMCSQALYMNTDMVVDHPFFFAIRDNMTGEMLFVGSVAEPK